VFQKLALPLQHLNISAAFKVEKSIFALLYGGGSGNAHIVTEMTKDT
jgi:hypothetical protein